MRGFFDLTSISGVARQQLGLTLGNFTELILKRFDDPSMKGASRLTKQCSVGRILDKRVLEQIARMRGHPLLEQQT